MASMKDIKLRIANIGTTKQIMSAMDMVSTSRLQKARARLDISRPLFSESTEIISPLIYNEDLSDNKFIRQDKIKKTLYIIITSDKGLCGSYNYNVSQLAYKHMKKRKNESLLIIGTKGREFFKQRSKSIYKTVSEISESRLYKFAKDIGEPVLEAYISNKVDEVYIAYTHFNSTLNYIPRIEKLLPLDKEILGENKLKTEMKFEPDTKIFLDNAIPMYIHAFLFAALSESLACEHASRMISMDAAKTNANELIDELNLLYNRKRQAAITQELNEIISGANLLK